MAYLRNIVLSIVLVMASHSAASPDIQTPAHPRQGEAESLSVKWLDLFTAGKSEETFALLSEIFKANLTPEVWKGAVDNSSRSLGKLLKRTHKRTVVYVNPRNAPLPGVYMAVEFDSEYENTLKHFQFLILHSQNGEPFKVMRHESTVAFRNGHSLQ